MRVLPRSRRSQRARVLAAVVALAASVVGCGDDRPVSSHSLPTGADDVVLRIEWQGGFVPIEEIQRRVPTVLVTGDGRLFLPAAVPEIYPGPLVLPVTVGTIERAAMAAIVRAADEAGLLGEVPDYELPPGVGIADAATTVVTITADGVTRVHRAYALGMVAETPERQRLAEFVALVGDLASLVGADALGEQGPYAPTAYRVTASPTDPSGYTEPFPTIRPWPASIGIALSTLAECRVVGAAEVGALFIEANELTFFTDEAATGDTTVYRLGVGPMLPGEVGCVEP